MSIESSSLLWKIKRLKSMSLFEIYIRIKRAVELKLFGIRSKYKLIDAPKSFKVRSVLDIQFDKTEHQSTITRIITEADKYLRNKWLFFGAEIVEEDNVNWHFDHINKKTAPKIFSFSINHRNYDEVGNIKVIWEKNRHHHLTIMALAYFITKDEKYAREVVEQIIHWIQDNPFLIGVNWTHPLENGIRLISWVYCERFLRGSVHYDVLFNKNSPFWLSVYQHQKFIIKTYSIGSSANNHLIGEMAGLFISSTFWPYFKKSNTWIKYSKKVLEKEIIRQSFPLGINREMAFGYQIFVYEFLLLSYLESKECNNLFSEIFTEYLKKNAAVISEVTRINQGIPNYGDGDEGMAIQLQDIKADRISWLLEITNSLFPELNLHFKNVTLPAAILRCSAINNNIPQDSKPIAFKDAGIYILNRKISNLKISVLVKAGPFGYGNIAAHSHADSLSFTLNINGIPFLIDPGTFCYHTDLEFRKYFRSTKAHNTLCIDNLDQSEQLGPFLWGKKSKTYVNVLSESGNIVNAYHTGYKNINIIHSREIELSDKLIITDEIKGKGQHLLDFRFHLDPDVKIYREENDYLLLRRENIQIKLNSPVELSLQKISGRNDGGWYSPRFNLKIPTTTLSYQKRLSLPTKQIFSIEFKIL
jgi:hypothetical protein